jgi:hypothetical protein
VAFAAFFRTIHCRLLQKQIIIIAAGDILWFVALAKDGIKDEIQWTVLNKDDKM